MQKLVRGVARLVEGQRRFADEFGLPYGRLFHDAFEAFKDQPPETVIRAWLDAGAEADGALEALFSDLLGHQLALVEALAAVSAAPDKTSGLAERLATLFRRAPQVRHDASHRDYMEVIAPVFVTAYASAREQVTPPASLPSGAGHSSSSSSQDL
ncbi:hypothetical protein [Isoalcanivorax indicus]|uniref:hypothetical protein n=1 Tax=Isoalcanivorax indicus TaxID=2202653 RepID=UPI000DB9B1F7|nr:hypothetical protein [Isoalcanivorax indicus]